MFKTVLSVVGFFAISMQVSAAEVVSEDNSPLSKICVAAVESKEALLAQAKEAGIGRFELNEITCNGLALSKFASKYRKNTARNALDLVVFEKSNNATETELCIAAATSNTLFEEARARLDVKFVGNISCNGEKLNAFAKRFNREFRAK